MPLSHLMKSAAGTCPFCRQKAGIIARAHRDYRETFEAGWTEMVAIAAEAARTHAFDEKTLRLSLAEIAQRSYGDGATVNQALEDGWKQGVAHSMADGIMSQAEETRLREFRDRLMLDARLATLAFVDADTHLNELSEALRQSQLYVVTGIATAIAVYLPIERLTTLEDASALLMTSLVDHHR